MYDNLKVSVIVPCYNVEFIIEHTINSILNQTYSNIELILINDGSTDNTEKIIKKYLSNNSIVYKYQDNQGVSVARNTGINIATGDYICFLDSDDYYEKTKIEKQVNALKQVDGNVCFCGSRITYTYSNKIKNNRYYKEGKILRDFIIQKAFITTNDWMIKLDFIKKHNLCFHKDLNYGEDFNFFMKILTLDKVISIKEQLTTYQLNEKSSSLNKKIRQNLEENYISEYIRWVNEQECDTYSEKELKSIIKILQNFLLPLVTINNIMFNRENQNFQISEYEKSVIKQFRFNFNNIKASLKVSLFIIRNVKLIWG